MSVTIKTNNVPRHLIYGYDLSAKEKADFDYIEDVDSHDFFRYRGAVYDPSEFMRVPDAPEFKGWDGYASDTYFSGVLVRYSKDMESVIVARFYS